MAVAMAVAWTMMATAVRAPMTRATMLARRTEGRGRPVRAARGWGGTEGAVEWRWSWASRWSRGEHGAFEVDRLSDQ